MPLPLHDGPTYTELTQAKAAQYARYGKDHVDDVVFALREMEVEATADDFMELREHTKWLAACDPLWVPLDAACFAALLTASASGTALVAPVRLKFEAALESFQACA